MQGVAHALEEAATRPNSDPARNVALIPEIATQRLSEQFARQNSTLRNIGKVTQQFRRTVLPYSTHWMFQIGTEAGIRALIAGALDPRYLADGRRLAKYLEDSPEGRAVNHEMTGATYYNKHDPYGIYNPNMGELTARVKGAPGLRTVIEMHNRYANMIGGAMGNLERQFRLMGLGKFAHQEALEFSHDWQNAVHLQTEVIQQLGEKLKADPALVAKLGRKIDDTFGQYSKFTPAQRAAIQSYMPFLPWYLTATRYVLWHLPAKHPIASGLMASLRQTMHQDIKDGKSEPLNIWAMQELARLTPFGVFHTRHAPTKSRRRVQGATVHERDPARELAGAGLEAYGRSPFGTGPLSDPPNASQSYKTKGEAQPGSTESVLAGIESLIEGLVPGARALHQAELGGRAAYGTSTIEHPEPKPGQGTIERR